MPMIDIKLDGGDQRVSRAPHLGCKHCRVIGELCGYCERAMLDDVERAASSWPVLDGTEGALQMFEVYAFPRAWPEHWVVQRSFALPTGEIRLDIVPRLASHLESARELLPPGLFWQPRCEQDLDPHLIEVWY